MKKLSSRFLIGTLFIMLTIPLLTYSISACTGVILEGEDGTVVYGRTQEWSGFDVHTKAAVYPEGLTYRGTTPDGENGMSWKGKYGFLSFLLLDRVINDGMNEKGLAGGTFYHEGFAKYEQYDPELAEESISPTDVLPYILSNFSSISEVKEGLKDVRVVPVWIRRSIRLPQCTFLWASRAELHL